MHILLTNDDGYESPGLQALAHGLDRVGDVTVVAPRNDQSGCGREVSEEVDVETFPRGYIVDGTPVDCVLTGLGALDLDIDLVIAGCNVGGNLGRYVLGRSGTVSAAVEASFHKLPAIATSLYVPDPQWPLAGTQDDFIEAVRATVYLAERIDSLQEAHPTGYLNVNAPMPGEDRATMRLTRPSDHYAMKAELREATVHIDDVVWARMADAPLSEPIHTDRGAVRRGDISVSALDVPYGNHDHDGLASIIGGVVPNDVE